MTLMTAAAAAAVAAAVVAGEQGVSILYVVDFG
jgi:hypothetical protein